MDGALDFFSQPSTQQEPHQQQPQLHQGGADPFAQPQAQVSGGGGGGKQPFKRGASKKANVKTSLDLDSFSKLAIQRNKEQKEDEDSEESEDSGSEDSEEEDGEDEWANQGTGKGFVYGSNNVSSSSSSASSASSASTNQNQSRNNNDPKRKTVGEWSIRKRTTTTRLGFVKNIATWKFYFKGEQHSIELRHSTFSGKRVIKVDGTQIVSEKDIIGGDSMHKVFAGSEYDNRCEVRIVLKVVRSKYQYGIFIAGLPIREAKEKFAEYAD